MADVQIAVIDQQNTEVTVAVPGIQGIQGQTGDVAVAQDGTAGTPGIRFENDTNTGIYRPGPDQVAISTNGTRRLLVDSSGLLHLQGSGATLRVDNSDAGANVYGDLINAVGGTTTLRARGGAATHGSISLNTWDGTTDSSRLFISPGGNVGIGDTGPDSTLTIKAAASTTPLRVSGPSSEFARVDSSGRLLVGLSSAFPVRIATTAITPQQQLAGTNGTASTFVQGCASTTDTTAAFHWFAKFASGTINDNTVSVNNGETLGQITWSGSDGANQTQAAQITAQADGTPGTNDMPGRLVFSTTADGASSPTERMRITQGGEVLIGKTVADNTTVGLRLSNNFAAFVRDSEIALLLNRLSTDGAIASFRRSSVEVGTISVTATATAYNTSSDYRLKENVTPVTDGITRLQQLKPSRFNFIADPTKTVDGFLAHEVQTVVPEAITGEKDAVDADGNPEYQGIDQSKLVPLLTAALQEAVAEINALKDRLTAAGI